MGMRHFFAEQNLTRMKTGQGNTYRGFSRMIADQNLATDFTDHTDQERLPEIAKIAGIAKIETRTSPWMNTDETDQNKVHPCDP
jgi:hypothetical protein